MYIEIRVNKIRNIFIDIIDFLNYLQIYILRNYDIKKKKKKKIRYNF